MLLAAPTMIRLGIIITIHVKEYFTIGRLPPDISPLISIFEQVRAEK